MGIAFHKKTDKKYVQYTLRLEEEILEDIKAISQKEDISINEVVNQSLQFAIDDYKKNKKWISADLKSICRYFLIE